MTAQILGNLVKWLFSKAMVIVLLWVLVLGGVAAWLAWKHHMGELPEQQQKLERELAEARGEIEELKADAEVVKERVEGEIVEIQESFAKAKAKLEAKAEAIAEAKKALETLRGLLNKIVSLFERGKQQDEIDRKSAELAAHEKESASLAEMMSGLKKRKGELDERLKASAEELQAILTDKEAALAKLEEQRGALDAQLADREAKVAAGKYWARKAFKVVGLSLMVATVVFLIGPMIWKTVMFYLWAPFISLARPVVIRKREVESREIRVSESQVALTIPLDRDERAIIKHKFYQATDDRLKKKTKFVFDWRYPFTSLASGLIELTEVTNPDEAPRRLTLSSQDEAEVEMVLIEVPDGGSLVCRPRFLSGIVTKTGERPRIRSHWRFFSVHAWVTFQFRYFEFRGPCRIALWAYRGVRAEQLGVDQDGVSYATRRTNQEATIGFTPALKYHCVRAETFWSYFRGKNLLFDDKFSGDGVFLCQQVSRAADGGKGERFWSRFWNALLKVVGL